MQRVFILTVLLGCLPMQLRGQSGVVLQSAVGFGALTRGESDRRTGVLILEGGGSVSAGPVRLGVGALWGTYESLDPFDRSRVSHRSFYAEGRRDLSFDGSPYLVSLAGRIGYDVEDDGNQRGDGVMYGGSVGLGRRLNQSVVLGVSGLATWYSLSGTIGDGRLMGVRLVAQISP